MSPEEEAIASKACEIYYCQFVSFEFCPMQQKTIPVENYNSGLLKELLAELIKLY